MLFSFKAPLGIIGINPYVSVPPAILEGIFSQAGKNKGPILVRGTVNGKPYKQTLVRYQGAWRLYINMTMLRNSPKRIGEMIEITISFDPVKRTVEPHPKFARALEQNRAAKAVFDGLRPSLQQEILRHLARLKRPESVDRNVERAIDFLLGNGRFIGRDKP